MTLDERLADAARRIADGLTPPEVDLAGVRMQARAQRRRAVSLTVAAAVVVVLVAATAIGLGRPTAAPLPPVGPLPSEGPLPSDAPTEADFGGVPPCAHTPEKEPPNQPVESDLQAWIDDLPPGAPPSTPYWHDGVLHVEGAEIDAPYDDVELDAAGRTVLVGGYENAGKNSGPTEWSYLGDDGLEPLPVPARQWPRLSADGRIAYWSTYPEPGTTQFFTWDTETNTALATRTLQGDDDMCARRVLLGIDAAGIGYWLDGSSDPSLAPDSEVVRWDVRADTIEATDLTYDPTQTFDQFDVWVGLEDAYVSPDGTREVFTGPGPWDASSDCCTSLLRVRPVGDLESVDSDEVVTLQLPTGVPSMRLWNAWSDRGTWGVWWESDETVLVDAVVDGRSHLIRCSTTGGACELVFDLGPNKSRKVFYQPEWEQDWGFARYPLKS